MPFADRAAPGTALAEAGIVLELADIAVVDIGPVGAGIAAPVKADTAVAVAEDTAVLEDIAVGDRELEHTTAPARN